MANKEYLVGLFKEEGKAVAAVEALAGSAFEVRRVNSPIPSHRLSAAMKVKKSRVGYFTLCGGIIGFFTGFLLAAFTASRWALIVGGKPVVALVPFFIVGFEFTILFAVLGNFIGFLFLTDLPRFDWAQHYDPRTSGEYFGILATCEPERREELSNLFVQQGGEVRTFEG